MLSTFSYQFYRSILSLPLWKLKLLLRSSGFCYSISQFSLSRALLCFAHAVVIKTVLFVHGSKFFSHDHHQASEKKNSTVVPAITTWKAQDLKNTIVCNSHKQWLYILSLPPHKYTTNLGNMTRLDFLFGYICLETFSSPSLMVKVLPGFQCPSSVLLHEAFLISYLEVPMHPGLSEPPCEHLPFSSVRP